MADNRVPATSPVKSHGTSVVQNVLSFIRKSPVVTRAKSQIKATIHQTRQYVLNESKAIDKKLAHTERQNVNTWLTQGGFRGKFSAGYYELLKQGIELFKSMQADILCIEKLNITDQIGHITEVRYNVNDIETNQKLYVINMYNTKSSCLINGGSLDIFIHKHIMEIYNCVGRISSPQEQNNFCEILKDQLLYIKANFNDYMYEQEEEIANGTDAENCDFEKLCSYECETISICDKTNLNEIVPESDLVTSTPIISQSFSDITSDKNVKGTDTTSKTVTSLSVVGSGVSLNVNSDMTREDNVKIIQDLDNKTVKNLQSTESSVRTVASASEAGSVVNLNENSAKTDKAENTNMTEKHSTLVSRSTTTQTDEENQLKEILQMFTSEIHTLKSVINELKVENNNFKANLIKINSENENKQVKLIRNLESKICELKADNKQFDVQSGIAAMRLDNIPDKTRTSYSSALTQCTNKVPPHQLAHHDKADQQPMSQQNNKPLLPTPTATDNSTNSHISKLDANNHYQPNARYPQTPYGPASYHPPQFKPTVALLGDSNFTPVDTDSMSERFAYSKYRCFTTDEARNTVNTMPLHSAIVLHTGTNDLRDQPVQDIFDALRRIVKSITDEGSKVVISLTLPRGNPSLNRKCFELNFLLRNFFKDVPNVALTSVKEFYVDKHLNSALYKQERRGGYNAPLLHLNTEGLRVLTTNIERAVHYLFK